LKQRERVKVKPYNLEWLQMFGHGYGRAIWFGLAGRDEIISRKRVDIET